MNTYTIHAYRSQETVDKGSDYDTTADTVVEAKKRARYCLSEGFRQSAEMSTRLGYAKVTNDRTGECVFDCFAK